jgi:hypothetical protein
VRTASKRPEQMKLRDRMCGVEIMWLIVDHIGPEFTTRASIHRRKLRIPLE